MNTTKRILVSNMAGLMMLGMAPSSIAHTPPGTPGPTAMTGMFAGFVAPPGPPPPAVGGPWAFVGLTIVVSGVFEGVPFSSAYACGAGGTRTGDVVQDSFTGAYACVAGPVILPPAPVLGGAISGFRVLNAISFTMDLATVAVPSPDPHRALCEGVIEPVTGAIVGNCTGS